MELENIVYINSEIDATDLNGEKVMMNLEKGKYFALNSIGSRIWGIIESEGEIELYGIVDKLLEEYDVTNEICEKAVLNFVGRLKDEELVLFK